MEADHPGGITPEADPLDADPHGGRPPPPHDGHVTCYACWEANPHVDRQTPVKTLHCPKLHLRAVTTLLWFSISENSIEDVYVWCDQNAFKGSTFQVVHNWKITFIGLLELIFSSYRASFGTLWIFCVFFYFSYILYGQTPEADSDLVVVSIEFSLCFETFGLYV